MKEQAKTCIRITTILLVLFGMLILSGCENKAHYEDVSRNALAYYQNKYGKKDVKITNSYKAGNSGLFGYIGVKDRAYEMSDGYSVYWDDSDGIFADNAQADIILEDFDREILEPELSKISYPRKTTTASLNRTGLESYDECVFTDFYDGDIYSFLEKEKPELSTFKLALETTDRDNCERNVNAFYEALKPYVSGWTDVFILSEGLDDLTGDEWYPSIREMNVLAKADLEYQKEIKWYRQVYIEVFDGIYMTSDEADFVLQEGDVRFEVIGTCEDLQQKIDEGYYHLPVDAEENKNGGYMVKDQRHENHIVLDDTSAPLYHICLSQRVLDALDERNCFSVYVIDRRENGLPLMMYYGDKTGSYNVYRVCDIGAEQASYEELNPKYLYYFGTHQSYEYDRE